MAKGVFSKMGTIFRNYKTSMQLKRRLLECYVISVLTYGCETWNLSNSDLGRQHAAEMWFLRRMMRVSYTAHESNHSMMQRAGASWYLVDKMRKRQAEFLGHVMRKGNAERLAITDRLDGRRGRDGQRTRTSGISKDGWTQRRGTSISSRRRRIEKYGIQRPDWGRNLTTTTRKNQKYVYLNWIPRNIRIVSNIFAGPKNIISDKYVTQKYHFG